MSATNLSVPVVEMAYVLFMDMVGYSRASLEEQAWMQEQLHSIVHSLEAYQQARGAGQLIELPAGDGMGLVFLNTPDAPVRCAIGLQRAIAEVASPLLQLRTGVNFGPISRGQDVTGATNARGPGVNDAQRVMDCGDGGHILLSSSAADVLSVLSTWKPLLHDLGECTVKHGKKLHLFNLYSTEVGNPVLPAKFSAEPAAAAAAGTKHNLPLPETPFIGRESELDEWASRLCEPSTRLVTLLGFGGMGKSRIAMEIARHSVEQHAALFPGGVWWLELAEAANAETMYQSIAYGMNLYLKPPPSAREQLMEALGSQNALLVLDNIEQISDAAAVIQDLLKVSPGSRVLTTSRRALGLRAERVIEVPPLPTADAVQLFVDRAQAHEADFQLDAINAEAVGQICRRLEGVPLAIELAASRIVGMEPEQILERVNNLEQQLNLLKARSPDLPARHRAVRATIDWSYNLLSEEDQLLFVQLSVFAGGFTLEDAEEVCEAFDVMESLMELRQHSLLRADSTSDRHQKRFSMLETLRTYACKKLEEMESEAETVRERHAKRFRELAKRWMAALRTRNEAAMLSQFERNLPNLRAALEWCVESPHLDWAVELALWQARFMENRGFLEEGERLVRLGLDALPRLSPARPDLECGLWQERAGLYLDHFEWAAARDACEQALRLADSVGDQKGKAIAHNLQGLAANGTEDFAAAMQMFEQALAEFRAAGDETGAVNVLNNLGVAEYNAGNTDAAIAHFQETVALRRKQGDNRGAAESENNLGVLAHYGGRLEEAWQHYLEALRLEQDLEHAFGVARAIANLGEVAENTSRLPLAYRLYSAALVLFHKIGSPYETETLTHRERVSAAIGQQNGISPAVPPGLPDRPLGELVAWALGEE